MEDKYIFTVNHKDSNWLLVKLISLSEIVKELKRCNNEVVIDKLLVSHLKTVVRIDLVQIVQLQIEFHFIRDKLVPVLVERHPVIVETDKVV